MNPGTLLIRADAGAAIGSGHVMRCLALAQGWRGAEGEVVFALAEATPAIERRLAEEDFRVVRVRGMPGSKGDLTETSALVEAEAPTWIVLDGYKFDVGYQSRMQDLRPLLVVDDDGLLESYTANIVLNQNLHARAEMYGRHAPHTRLLLGTRYAMLRNEFSAYRDWTRAIPERGTRVLVTMGGSDPGNFAPGVVGELAKLPGNNLQIRAIAGGSAGNVEELERLATDFPQRIQVTRDARSMVEHLAWADLVIAGAGTTCWEICLLGAPAIVAVAAENQRRIARSMASTGAAIDAGLVSEVKLSWLASRVREILDDARLRTEMSRRARQLVDGRGTERVVEALQQGDLPCV